MKLSECKKNDMVVVVRVHGDRPLKARLISMGINRGAVIKVIKYAPLRDPLQIAVDHVQIGLRVNEAAQIEVASAGKSPEKL